MTKRQRLTIATCAKGSSEVERWEFGDPLDVAIRREARTINAGNRRNRQLAHKQRRIRALVAKVMRRAA